VERDRRDHGLRQGLQCARQAGRDVVVERAVPPAAHDIEREHHILDRLAAATAPVPRPLALCDDPAVSGDVFYVMEQVPGTV
jgi:aminoglycoside phosphotransferase (APT) family kinase protein